MGRNDGGGWRIYSNFDGSESSVTENCKKKTKLIDFGGLIPDGRSKGMSDYIRSLR